MSYMPSFRTNYDHRADVLYVTFLASDIVRGIEDRNGIVWRYDRSNELAGLIIMDFVDRWENNEDDLAYAISSESHYPPDATLAMIQSVRR